MSIEIGNEEKLLGQIASNRGYSDLIAVAKRPVLRTLFSGGFTTHVDTCVEALNDLADDPKTNKNVADTARNMAKMMAGESFIVITDGTSDEDDE